MARYIILLETSRPLSGSDAAAWTAWAEELDSASRLESADLILDEGRIVAGDSADAEVPAGDGLSACAVIYASDIDDATQLAASFPGLREGEELTIRPLVGSGSPELEDEDLPEDAADKDLMLDEEDDDDGLVR